MPFYKTGRGRKLAEWLTHEEMDMMYKAADNVRDLMLIYFAYYTGFRAAEVSNCQVKDISWTEGTIKVRQGKGSKDRIIAMHSNLKILMEQWLKSVKENPETYIFPGTKGKGITTRQIYGIVSKTSKRTEIKKKVHPHTLRHTIAMHLFKDGKSMVVISRFLGHASIATTQIYADADVNDQIEMMSKF
jgi:site-specific recombinase XerD